MTERRRRRALSALVLALALSACTSSTDTTQASNASSHGPSTPVAGQPSLMFVSYSDTVALPGDSEDFASDARVAGPDGRGWQVLIPGSEKITRLWSSADGSVIAYRVLTGKAPMGEPAPAGIWVISSHGTQRIPVTPALLGVAAVAADGHAVYVTHGHDVVRYDVRTGDVTTMCTQCVRWQQHPLSIAISADESRIAVSSFPNGDATIHESSDVTIIDAHSGDTLWTHEYLSLTRAEAFLDDTSLVTTVESEVSADRAPSNGALHILSGIGSGHVADRPTGISAYGPVDHVGGTWWYYRDSWDWVTSVYTNTDLTPAHETKVADRVDGTTSYDYHPVTSGAVLPSAVPAGPILVARPTVSPTG
jgi:hypothetical protein